MYNIRTVFVWLKVFWDKSHLKNYVVGVGSFYKLNSYLTKPAFDIIAKKEEKLWKKRSYAMIFVVIYQALKLLRMKTNDVVLLAW